MRNDSRWLLVVAASFFALGGAAGCEWFEGAIEETTQTVQKTTEKVVDTAANAIEENTPAEKFVKLVVGTRSVSSATCSVKLIPPIAGRPAVLKITSYEDPSAESFPSILIQANAAGSTSVNDIIDQPLQAQIKVATSDVDPVWFTPDDQPANITIRSADDSGRVIGVIINGIVANSGNADELKIKGDFDGTLQ